MDKETRHNIKNLLGQIVGNASLLRHMDNSNWNADKSKMLKEIEDAGNKIAEIIKEPDATLVAKYSAIDSGEIQNNEE